MEVVLLKDLVIPKGSIFGTAPSKTERVGDGHIERTFGLSKNTYGTVTYSLSDANGELDEWFAEVER